MSSSQIWLMLGLVSFCTVAAATYAIYYGIKQYKRQSDTKPQLSYTHPRILLISLLIGAIVGIYVFQASCCSPDIQENRMKKTAIAEQCNTFCNNVKGAKTNISFLTRAVTYCTETFSADINQDGTIDDVVGTGDNRYCENGVFCFNIHTCRPQTTSLNAETCEKIVTEYYKRVEGVEEKKARQISSNVFNEKRGTFPLSAEERNAT